MGLDKPEHGLPTAYADFMPVVPSVLGTKTAQGRHLGEAAAAAAAPAQAVAGH